MSDLWDEKEYRKNVLERFQKIVQVVDEFDPDMIEAELSQGSLTILCQDKSKIILSQQPSVRQIWLAVAAQGTAMHFSWNADQKKWLDDKGLGAELYSSLSQALSKATGIDIRLG